MRVNTLTKIAIIAALYAALTVALPLQYEAVQFRVAEILTLLCFYDKKYRPALIIGCFIANLFSPLGPIDWVVGTAATVFAVIPMAWFQKFKNGIWIAALFPVIANGIIVGIELRIVFDAPLFVSMATVALGEAAVMAVGVVLFRYFLEKRGFFKKILF